MIPSWASLQNCLDASWALTLGATRGARIYYGILHLQTHGMEAPHAAPNRSVARARPGTQPLSH